MSYVGVKTRYSLDLFIHPLILDKTAPRKSYWLVKLVSVICKCSLAKYLNADTCEFVLSVIKIACLL